MSPSSAQRLPGLLHDKGLCVFNGIDGATGEYLLSPRPLQQLADWARQEPRFRLPQGGRGKPDGGGLQEKAPGEGVDPCDLSQAGWGVIFADSPGSIAARKALSPLLEYRKGQCEGRYKELTYRPGESKTGFLARHGVAPGPADPSRVPYYLLLVGDPEEIPFEFQYNLDIQYAVGRLHFEEAEDYATYARTVVAAEEGRLRRPATAAFFGPRNAGDLPTERSANHLAAPLAEGLGARDNGWSVRTMLGDDATKASLKSCLEVDGPSFLFTAGHGLCFRSTDRRQPSLQGSLICQDWPGPGHPIEEEHYFSREDLSSDAQIAGMIAFHFSCYGAGTPRSDSFEQGRGEIAPRAFVSPLAQRLLAHPGGGALAVVGHVDLAWSWSFGDPGGEGHTLRPVFENTLTRLTSGFPVGYAMEYFNSCFAELSSDLDEEIRRCRDDRDPWIACLWINRNDARSYTVLGDPAVRFGKAQKENS